MTASDGESGTISNPEAEEMVNYDVMPKETELLDDKEFQVYVTLRAWRLRRKNELEVEPYKICQNRTLCELIRRRRNDTTFASRQKGEGDTKNKKDGNDDEDQAVEQDLLSVWGIGPSKAAHGGFGWEMLDVLDSKENAELLELSRKNSLGKDIY